MPTTKTTQKMRAIGDDGNTRTKDVHFRTTSEELVRYCLAAQRVRPKVSGLSDLIRRLLDAECDRLGIPERLRR